jgi:hypothetical protein
VKKGEIALRVARDLTREKVDSGIMKGSDALIAAQNEVNASFREAMLEELLAAQDAFDAAIKDNPPGGLVDLGGIITKAIALLK